MFNPGITNADQVQSEMIEDLVESDTQLLLLDDQVADTSESSNAGRTPGSIILDEFIARQYAVACDFGDTRILANRDRKSRVRCVEPTGESLVDILARLGP